MNIWTPQNFIPCVYMQSHVPILGLFCNHQSRIIMLISVNTLIITLIHLCPYVPLLSTIATVFTWITNCFLEQQCPCTRAVISKSVVQTRISPREILWFHSDKWVIRAQSRNNRLCTCFRSGLLRCIQCARNFCRVTCPIVLESWESAVAAFVWRNMSMSGRFRPVSVFL